MGTLSGDGYYQELDEHLYGEELFEDSKPIKEKKRRDELSYKDPKYDEIHNTLMERNPNRNMVSRSYRNAFCNERNKIHKERADSFNTDKADWEKLSPPKSKVFCKCKTCGGGFEAKLADRKRGWARFCSKSCKAQAW